MKPRSARASAKAAAGIVAAAMLLVTACSSDSGSSAAPAPTDSGGAITVWVDPPRVPAAEAFKKAHPEIDVTINQIDGTVGGKSLQQQFAQFNQAGKGWPDAIFFPSNDDIAWATGAQINYAADLTDLVPDVIKGYDGAVNEPCNVDGRVRCLRNDAAPDVFWYNKKFFDTSRLHRPEHLGGVRGSRGQDRSRAPREDQWVHRRCLRTRSVPLGLRLPDQSAGV